MSTCPHCGKENATMANCFPYNNEDEDETLCWLEYHGHCEALPPNPMKTAPQIIQELESKLRYQQAKSREMERTVHELRTFIKRMEIQMKSCLESIAANHRAMKKLEQKGPDQ